MAGHSPLTDALRNILRACRTFNQFQIDETGGLARKSKMLPFAKRTMV